MLACRSLPRAELAIAEIHAAAAAADSGGGGGGHGRLEALQLDMADRESIEAFARTLEG